VGGDLDLAVANLLDGDGISEVADTAVDLDLVLEELLEGSGVEDLVAGGLRSVDDVLQTESQSQIPIRLCLGAESYLLGLLGRLASLLLYITLAYCIISTRFFTSPLQEEVRKDPG
jgi:hypothetical protein